ncbi:MAG TPA: hypothetical protein DD733_07915 [Clostridiales bacterium]|nr:hypothetical protein [Clostridiales bacterium]
MEFEPLNDFVPNGELIENLLEEHSFPSRISLAMAYVPYQPFNNLYDNETGFSRGTIFKALDLPFLGEKGAGK